MLIECCNVTKFGKCDVTVFQEERMVSVHLSPIKIMLEEKFNTGSTQYDGENRILMIVYCIVLPLTINAQSFTITIVSLEQHFLLLVSRNQERIMAHSKGFKPLTSTFGGPFKQFSAN